MSYDIIDTPNPILAVNWIRDNAVSLAKAKANRVYLEEFRKTKKALLMQEVAQKFPAFAAQEREAYAHKEYQDLILGLKEAVEEEEKLKWQMTAAMNKIEIWRTAESTKRAELRAI
jgi:hypothetical protein